MDADRRAQLDSERDFSTKSFPAFCYAPFVSLYLHPLGDVFACCRNTEQRLGTVQKSSLTEIWRGPTTQRLRRALAEYRTTWGCAYCDWQASSNGFESSLASSYDTFSVEDAEPDWPKVIEFGLSNTCNLECVMCNGDLSSKIRSRREGRPPLKSPYDEAFFSELEAFLPHLVAAKFYGGEPFLARESLRVMEMMIKGALSTQCLVTTNGTIWNAQVERILEELDVSIALSIDGLSDDVLSNIRVGVDPSSLRRNVDRFRMKTESRGSTMVLNFCFMQQNWKEFESILRFGDDKGIRVFVNTVTNVPFSPFCMVTEDFDQMLDSLERRDAAMQRTLALNVDVWDRQLAVLRSWREEARNSAPQSVSIRQTQKAPPADGLYFQPRSVPTAGPGGAVLERPSQLEAMATARARHDMPDAQISVLTCNERDTVTAVRTGQADRLEQTYVNVPSSECVGRTYTDVMHLATRPYGGLVRTTFDAVVDGLTIREVIVGRTSDGSGDGELYARACSYPVHEDGEYSGSVTVVAWTTTKPRWASAESTSSP